MHQYMNAAKNKNPNDLVCCFIDSKENGGGDMGNDDKENREVDDGGFEEHRNRNGPTNTLSSSTES